MNDTRTGKFFFYGVNALVIVFLSCLPGSANADENEYRDKRSKMVAEVELYTRMIEEDQVDWFDPSVLESMLQVERHEFVPASKKHSAYYNRPLPIGHGQTISQPYIVALMTDLVKPDDNDVVLEIGTGSGYQAAVLANLVKHVYSIEIVEPLAQEATERLGRLGYKNVTTHLGDGYYGWQEHAPFDSIIVTAAASHVPQPLVEQLRPGGRMVIPVGGRFMTQHLLLIEKTEDGAVKSRQILAVSFVPLTGEH